MCLLVYGHSIKYMLLWLHNILVPTLDRDVLNKHLLFYGKLLLLFPTFINVKTRIYLLIKYMYYVPIISSLNFAVTTYFLIFFKVLNCFFNGKLLLLFSTFNNVKTIIYLKWNIHMCLFELCCRNQFFYFFFKACF